MFEILEQANFNLNEYDEALVKQLISKVTVVSEEKIQITFKGGLEVEQDYKIDIKARKSRHKCVAGFSALIDISVDFR